MVKLLITVAYLFLEAFLEAYWMKIPEVVQFKFKTFILSLLALAVILITSFSYVYSNGRFSRPIYLDNLPASASYVIDNENVSGMVYYFSTRYDGAILWNQTNFSYIFQSVLNIMTNGEKLCFMKGLYILNTTIQICGNKNVVLEGENIESTILKNNALTTTMIELGDGSNASNDYTGRLIIRNLQFHGNDKNVNIIYLSNIANNNFNLLTETVKFRNYGTDPAIDSNTRWFIDCQFWDTKFWFGGTSIKLKQPSHTFYSCHFWELDNGVYFEQGAGAHFYGGIFSHNTRDVVFANDTNFPDVFSFSGVWFEDSADVVIASDNSTINQLTLESCNLHTAGTYIVYLPNCNGSVTIIGGQKRADSNSGALEFGNMHVTTINYADFVTSNSGVANGTSPFWVVHGLAGTPTSVVITPWSNITSWYVSSRNATMFQITFTGEGVVTFDWYAEHKQEES
jgi:hypothetical protein